eukprot:CAMPEP_0171702770 /NCGR_PEP_ID=MMETSP0991-20121206/11778_1 /TAXON_ID=483369 /ORGANISM="non described non described, Strain CCMP2098" /LENGTH=327 /DNA_ID=CAMNT_0012292145 /DNA_START=272 /DNA_END=1255 /DNA_ORIENTATION=-
MSTKPTVLVFLATSRQGSATIDALLASGKFKVAGTTRSGASPALAAKGVDMFPFKMGDQASAEAAIQASGASLVWFTTLMQPTRAKEAAHGTSIVDACLASNAVQHVVFSSVADADKAPDAVAHFKSKFDIENHLKASGLAFSILRPVAFFENFDDPNNWNALAKGSIKGLWPASLSVLCVATADIGKAGAVMLANPAAWAGQTLDCASEAVDGTQLAAALTQASGVESSYALAMPPLAIKLFLNDLHHMIAFFADPGFSCDPAALKAVVPDALGIDAWLATKGHWADGEPFMPLTKGQAPAKPPSGNFKKVLFFGGAVALGAIFFF